jgi:hypothetical protein
MSGERQEDIPGYGYGTQEIAKSPLTLACVLTSRSFAMGFISIAKLLACRFLSSQALLLRAG